MSLVHKSPLIAAIALVAMLPAQAATWNKHTSGGSCASVSGSATTSCTVNATTDAAGSGSTMTMTGWSNAATGTSTSTTGTWRAAAITNQGDAGVGIHHGNTTADPNEGAGTAPGYEHSIDNDGRTDAIRLDFGGTAVALDKITMGWRGQDADFTLLRWVGNGSLGGGTAGGMTHWGVNAGNNVATDTDATAAGWSGWQLVANYAGPGTAGPTPTDWTQTVNAAGLTSSYWLIIAYNSAFGSGAGLEMGNYDAFKFLAASTKSTSSVSEPGVLALAGFGLLAGYVSRRRRAG